MSQQQNNEEAPFELDTYYLAFLRKGPIWTPEATPEIEDLQRRHLAHLSHLHETGKILVAGPIEGGPDDLRGITIFCTETLAEARALADADPSVQAGRLVIEIMTWYVPKGVLGGHAAR